MTLALLMIGVGLVASAAGCALGWYLRSRQVAEEVKERVAEAQAAEVRWRERTMRDNGRETWPRPEHEDQVGSRVTDIDLSGR